MALDPRKLETELIGTPTRDGAVTPRPSDFLGPTNAGEEGEQGNPHGPHVVSPGIHASEHVSTIRPGPVYAEPGEQNDALLEHLATVLPGVIPAPEPEPEEPDEDGGE